jgi:molybdopterin-guanine dinucleotide biosynthesis protein A
MRTSDDDPQGPGHDGGPALSNLAGLVLCGGESRRMGSDKGLLQKEGIPWAVHMGHKLTPWQLPVFYSINSRQKDTYGAILPAERLITDAMGLAGPLEGLFSAHARFPKKDWLLLACDMPDLDGTAIRGVIDAWRTYRKEEYYDFYVYQEAAPGSSEGTPGPVEGTREFAEAAPGLSFVQPFCGIYTSAGLAGAYASHRMRDTEDLSLQSLLKKGRTRKLPLDRADAFRNYNSL